MIFKTIEQIHSVWVSTEPSFEKIKLNFIEKKQSCKFEKDFHLKGRFLDYDHAISLWLPENEDSGFDGIINEIKAICKVNGIINEVTYIFSLMDFNYDGSVKNNSELVFLGNIPLHFQIRDFRAELRE